MHEPMVVVAEQDQVGQIARSTSSPMDDVVRTRPIDLAVAAGEPAALVSHPQRPHRRRRNHSRRPPRSEEHTSELQSHVNLVCRLLLEKKKNKYNDLYTKKKIKKKK